MELLETLKRILSTDFMHNSLAEWLIFIVGVNVLYSLMTGLRYLFNYQWRDHLAKSWAAFRIVGVLVNSTTKPFLFAISLYVGAQVLNIPPKQAHLLGLLPSVAFLLQLGVWGKSLLEYKLHGIIESKQALNERQQFQTLVTPIKFMALSLLWGLIILAVLDNLGVNVTALVAGLGIGGVAVALAVQNTLTDFLAALTIALDRPFIVGDFISTNSYLGTVERIGLKTTRIRSLSGEELAIPNQDLLTSRIQNYKRMDERRVVFGFNLPYTTPPEKLEQTSAMVREVISGMEQTRFDRAHLAKFGDFSHVYEVVYYVLSPDYNIYMDIQQAINLEIVRRLQSMELSFAIPAQTLFMQNAAAQERFQLQAFSQSPSVAEGEPA